MNKRILVIDDAMNTGENIKHILKEQYDVCYLYHTEENMKEFLKLHYSLVIQSMQEFQKQDFVFVETLRKVNPVPIMILSGNYDSDEMVHMIDAGADVYLDANQPTKECMAYVRALIRRYVELNRISQLEVQHLENRGLVLDQAERKVYQNQKEIILTRKEFDFLFLLMSNSGRVFSYKQLYHYLWDEDYINNLNSINCFIKRLRKKFVSECPIRNQRGFGYCIDK